MDNLVSGIKEKVNAVIDAVKGVAAKIKSFLGFSEPEEGPLSNFHTYAPDMMKLFAQGIRDNEHLITDQIKKSFDFEDQIIPVRTSVKRSNIDGEGNRGQTIWNINFNQPVESPDEAARELRLASQYGLIRGGEPVGES